MSLNQLIIEKYGSVDKMIESTETTLSRSYLYKILSGEPVNISLSVMIELQRILELPSLEDVKKAIDNVVKKV